MPLARNAGWNALIATLVLSVMVHGLCLLALSLQRGREPEKLRVVARVDVVDKLQLPKQMQVERPRIQVPDVPLPDKVVQRQGHKGTRPGVGGDPAPAPKSLKMELPKSTTPQAARRDSPMLSDRSIDGDPDRGNAFGDPNGVHGGTGTGGNGPGGTGGSGDGGVAPPRPATPEDIVRQGVIDCAGCHDVTPVPERPDGTRGGQPLNVEQLSNTTGWNIGPARSNSSTPIEVEFEYQLAADGKVERLRILKTSSDPDIAEGLKYFAMMHQFTPPGVACTKIAKYKFYPPPGL